MVKQAQIDKKRLDRLRAKRGGHRGVGTKLAKEANEKVTSEDGDTSQGLVMKNLLQGRMKLLNEIDDEILVLCEVENIESESKNLR